MVIKEQSQARNQTTTAVVGAHPRPRFAFPNGKRNPSVESIIRARSTPMGYENDWIKKSHDLLSNEDDERNWITETRSGIKSIVSEITSLLEENSEEGWDGYNAKPISTISCNYAIRLLQSIDSNTFLPEIIAEPTGQIGIQWDLGSCSLIVTFNETGVLSFGYHDSYGAEIFGSFKYTNGVPVEIRPYLNKFRS